MSIFVNDFSFKKVTMMAGTIAIDLVMRYFPNRVPNFIGNIKSKIISIVELPRTNLYKDECLAERFEKLISSGIVFKWGVCKKPAKKKKIKNTGPGYPNRDLLLGTSSKPKYFGLKPKYSGFIFLEKCSGFFIAEYLSRPEFS